jgi:hypothetical protein
MEIYAEECNFLENRQFSRQDLQEQHFNHCIRNLDACPRNYNKYQSVIFLFHFFNEGFRKCAQFAYSDADVNN